jgi:hypothetical protein
MTPDVLMTYSLNPGFNASALLAAHTSEVRETPRLILYGTSLFKEVSNRKG